MASSPRMSHEERRDAIIKVARQMFARKGFHGTTTRELAVAAGISEALLFKHFPDKESLYSAMLVSCCKERDIGRMEHIRSLEPSSSTLVLMVHFLSCLLLTGRDEEQEVQDRLIFRSLAEDGSFAQVVLRLLESGWIAKAEECLKASIASGDALASPFAPKVGAWFAYNLAAAVKQFLLPTSIVIDYGMPPARLVEQVVWFTLRGMGLKEATIRRHYNARALALFAD